MKAFALIFKKYYRPFNPSHPMIKLRYKARMINPKAFINENHKAGGRVSGSKDQVKTWNDRRLIKPTGAGGAENCSAKKIKLLPAR